MAQNYKNHPRFSWTYHGLTLLSIIALMIGSVMNLMNADESNDYSAALLVLVSLVLLSLYIHSRIFALRAQDRAIRAEESLRHFILTGKPVDKRLTLQQLIALRFASDEELPSLAQQAAAGNWSNKTIKQKITNWRPDTRRV